jgi:cytochrome c oxidase subunit 2
VTGITRSAIDPQGPAAESISGLWWLMLGLGVAVFTLVAVLLGIGLFRRRPDEGSEADEDDDPRRVRRWVLGGGVVLPLVVIGIVLAATVGTMRDIPTTAPGGALSVEVVGHQWWWEVRYPEGGVTTANELHLPVGRAVSVKVRSADVIHSLWVPALAGKMDALPDKANTLVLQADQPGEHHSECAEFCGLQHRHMKLVVTAEPEAAFASWMSGQQRSAAEPATTEARRGRDVFLRTGCASCHTIRGTTVAVSRAPDLTHVAQRPTLGAGALPNTAGDLAAWVADPHASKDGVLMPKPRLTDEQLADLLAYLGELR